MLDAVMIPPNELFAVLIAISFAAGLNVYATVATLGLLAHTGVFPLPPALQTLSSWYVIAGAGILFLVELFADKIPVFDLLWNALHTFVRVPVAALLAYEATAQLSPGRQLVATLLGGVIALAAHSGKTAVRAAVTPYPEPFSNVTLSLGEDALAVLLTWLATRHPYWAAMIALALVLVVVLLIHWVVRALRDMLHRARKELDLIFHGV
jgi:tellurite resistance protein TehA-like permease